MDKKQALTAMITAIATLLGALGAFSLKIEYIRGEHQRELGEQGRRVTISLMKGCEKN